MKNKMMNQMPILPLRHSGEVVSLFQDTEIVNGMVVVAIKDKQELISSFQGFAMIDSKKCPVVLVLIKDADGKLFFDRHIYLPSGKKVFTEHQNKDAECHFEEWEKALSA